MNKYTEAWAAGLVDLNHDPEGNVEKVFEIYIRTTPERLWQAVTDPEARARYQVGARIQSDWAIGSSYQVEHAGAPGPLIPGENLEIDPPRRLVQSFRARTTNCARAPTSTSTAAGR